MNYLITTTYQKNTYSHIIEGLSSNEVQELFVPNSIIPVTAGDPNVSRDEFDLVAKLSYLGKEFQIISHVKKVIELYGWIKEEAKKLKGEKEKKLEKGVEEQEELKILSINSKHKPLSDEQSQALIAQLETQFQQKEQAITPTVRKLVEDMQKDIADFMIRFKGYTDERDLDVLQTWSHDLDMFVSQGNLAEIRARMEQIIEKMELLESNYVKQINTDKDIPLLSFNQELHTIMNQNRLFRHHGLNQLSGGSKLDFAIYKMFSSLKLRRDAVRMEIQTIHDTFNIVVRQLLHIVIWALICALTILYIYKTFFDSTIEYPLLRFGIIGLVSLMCYAVAKKSFGIALSFMCIFVILGYVGYEFIRINLGM